MTQQIFFDEVLQLFIADDNFHILLGTISGDVSTQGKDLSIPVGKLIIPKNKLLNLLPDLIAAAKELTNEETPLAVNDDSDHDKKVYEGKPIIFRVG